MATVATSGHSRRRARRRITATRVDRATFRRSAAQARLRIMETAAGSGRLLRPATATATAAIVRALRPAATELRVRAGLVRVRGVPADRPRACTAVITGHSRHRLAASRVRRPTGRHRTCLQAGATEADTGIGPLPVRRSRAGPTPVRTGRDPRVRRSI